MKVRFIIPNQFGSSYMRGVQVSHALGKKDIDSKFVKEVGDTKDSICIFIKDFDPDELLKAKNQGNFCIFDPVDKFAKKGMMNEIPAFPLFDHAIFCTRFIQDYFNPLFQSSSVIEHHWDPNLQRECERFAAYPYDLRIGYIGMSFNHSFAKELADVLPIYNVHQWVEWAPFFTAHYAVKDNTTPECLFKPTTKISTASAVNANVLTMKDPNTVELLGEDYPYFIEDFDPEKVFKQIEHMQDTFEDETWFEALKIMSEVRKRTSLDAVSDTYIKLLQEIAK